MAPARMFPDRELCICGIDIILAQVMALGKVETAQGRGAWFTVYGTMPLVLSFASPFEAYKAREELFDATRMMPEKKRLAA